MKTFNDTLNNLKPTEIKTDSPQEFFANLFDELDSKFTILRGSADIREVKKHILSKVEMSQLGENQKDLIVGDINEISNYTQLFMYFEQQIKGL
jgi:hypothetical protein